MISSLVSGIKPPNMLPTYSFHSSSTQKKSSTLQSIEQIQELNDRGRLDIQHYEMSYADNPLPTESQLSELKDKYGDAQFTKEQYQSFLQDLTNMGIINEVESQLAGKETAIRVCIPVATATVSPANLYNGIDFFQLDKNTNMTEWIKYRAACDTFYFTNGTTHESSVDELYGYISNIISEIKK